MSDENDKDLDDKGQDIPGDQQEHDEWTPTEAEEKALNDGWQPKEEWVESGKDPEEWVSAREFNRAGELMSRITQQGRRIGTLEQQLQKAQSAIVASDGITQKLIQDAVDRTKRSLQKERREAMKDEDFETVDRIDNELDELRDATTSATTSSQDESKADAAPQYDPILASWAMYVANTPEVQSDNVFNPLLQYAESIRGEVGSDVGKFMRKVMDKADTLRGQRRRVAPPSGPDEGKGGNRNKQPASRGDKFSAADLNDQQKFIAQGYVDDGAYDSLDEYAKVLGENGGLDKQKR